MNNIKVYSEKEYRMAITELLVILDNIPRADYEKIPKSVIDELKMNADNTYNFKIDYEKDLTEQKISEITKAFIENIYRDYWVTEVEKEKIIEEERKERERIEIEKKEKYTPDNIFKNDQNDKKIIENKTMQLTEIKEKSFFEKVLDKIIKFFKRGSNL